MAENAKETVRTSIRFDPDLHGRLSDYVHAKKRGGEKKTSIEGEIKRAVTMLLSDDSHSSIPAKELDGGYPYPNTRKEHESLESLLQKHPGLAERIIGYLDGISPESAQKQTVGRRVKKGRMGVMGRREA